MRQVLQNPSGTTIVRDVPVPDCPPGNVLVRNAFSAISSGTERSRVEASQQSLVSRVIDRPELALKAVNRVRKDGLRQTQSLIRETLTEESPTGYSSAGVVIQLGAAVRGLAVGDRVACGGAGHANHAELVSVPRNLCARVPDGVPLEAASLTTIAIIALHGIRLSDVRLGDRVAVIGCGLVGQIAIRLLLASGAIVHALDIDSVRVDAARAAGAQFGWDISEDTAERVRGASDGLGVDHVLVTAAARTNAPLILATNLARDRGSVVLVGDAHIEIPRAQFFDKELTFRVSRSYGPGRYDADYEERGLDYPIGYVRWTEHRNMECVLDMQARGTLVLGDLVSDVVPVEQAESAYARLAGPAEQRPQGAMLFSYGEPGAEHAPPAGVRDLAPTPPGGAIRIGLIGPGGFAGGVLVPALKDAGANLEAVAGGAGPSAEAMVRRSGFRRFLDGADALFADDAIDAVVIATRHDSHAALSRAALDAGKHVFCEKPLALDHDDLMGVVEAAQENRRVLTVGFNRRFAPLVIKLRDHIADHGPVTAVYRVSAGQLPQESWVHDLDRGGGRLIGECCHFLDTLVFLAASPISRVHAAGFGGDAIPVQAWDNLVLSVSFANGSVATVVYAAAGASGVPKERLEVFAGTRTAILDDYTTLDLHDGQDHHRERLRSQDKGHTAEITSFLEAVQSGRDPIPLQTLLNVHESCFAAVESLRTGGLVEIS